MHAIPNFPKRKNIQTNRFVTNYFLISPNILSHFLTKYSNISTLQKKLFSCIIECCADNINVDKFVAKVWIFLPLISWKLSLHDKTKKKIESLNFVVSIDYVSVKNFYRAIDDQNLIFYSFCAFNPNQRWWQTKFLIKSIIKCSYQWIRVETLRS